MSKPIKIGLLLAAVAAGAALRWWHLPDQGLINYDQAAYLSALRYRDPVTADSSTFYARPALHWAMAAVAHGSGWAPWTNSVISAVFGAGTVLLTTLWALRLGGWASALVAALLVGCSSSHLLLSRLGIGITECGFWATACWMVHAKAFRPGEAFGVAAPSLPRKRLVFYGITVGLATLLLVIKLAVAALYPEKQAIRAFIMAAAPQLQITAWVAGTVVAVWLVKRILSSNHWETCLLALAGVLGGIAVLWHYTALWLLPFPWVLYELYISRFHGSWGRCFSRLLTLFLGMALPILLAQGVGFPNHMYLRELAGIIGGNLHCQLTAGNPTYYFHVFWNRDGPFWSLLSGLGFIFGGVLAWKENRRDVALPWLAVFGIVGLMSFVSAFGGLALGRGVTFAIPPLAAVSGWGLGRLGELALLRKIGRPVMALGLSAALLAVSWPRLAAIVQLRSEVSVAARYIQSTVRISEKIAYLKDPPFWVYYFGPQRVVPILSNRLPSVRFVVLNQVFPEEIYRTMGDRAPSLVISNPPERFLPLLYEVGGGIPSEASLPSGKILIYVSDDA